jgi:hypothetical protein
MKSDILKVIGKKGLSGVFSPRSDPFCRFKPLPRSQAGEKKLHFSGKG